MKHKLTSDEQLAFAVEITLPRLRARGQDFGGGDIAAMENEIMNLVSDYMRAALPDWLTNRHIRIDGEPEVRFSDWAVIETPEGDRPQRMAVDMMREAEMEMVTGRRTITAAEVPPPPKGRELTPGELLDWQRSWALLKGAVLVDAEGNRI